jgi:hypothetical protein
VASWEENRDYILRKLSEGTAGDRTGAFEEWKARYEASGAPTSQEGMMSKAEYGNFLNTGKIEQLEGAAGLTKAQGGASGQAIAPEYYQSVAQQPPPMLSIYGGTGIGGLDLSNIYKNINNLYTEKTGEKWVPPATTTTAPPKNYLYGGEGFKEALGEGYGESGLIKDIKDNNIAQGPMDSIADITDRLENSNLKDVDWDAVREEHKESVIGNVEKWYKSIDDPNSLTDLGDYTRYMYLQQREGKITDKEAEQAINARREAMGLPKVIAGGEDNLGLKWKYDKSTKKETDNMYEDVLTGVGGYWDNIHGSGGFSKMAASLGANPIFNAGLGIATGGLSGLMQGAIMGGVPAALKGGDISDIIKDAALGGVIGGAGEIANGVLNRLPDDTVLKLGESIGKAGEVAKGALEGAVDLISKIPGMEGKEGDILEFAGEFIKQGAGKGDLPISAKDIYSAYKDMEAIADEKSPAWQPPDISDVLGDPQIQVPDYSLDPTEEEENGGGGGGEEGAPEAPTEAPPAEAPSEGTEDPTQGEGPPNEVIEDPFEPAFPEDGMGGEPFEVEVPPEIERSVGYKDALEKEDVWVWSGGVLRNTTTGASREVTRPDTMQEGGFYNGDAELIVGEEAAEKEESVDSGLTLGGWPDINTNDTPLSDEILGGSSGGTGGTGGTGEGDLGLGLGGFEEVPIDGTTGTGDGSGEGPGTGDGTGGGTGGGLGGGLTGSPVGGYEFDPLGLFRNFQMGQPSNKAVLAAMGLLK